MPAIKGAIIRWAIEQGVTITNGQMDRLAEIMVEKFTSTNKPMVGEAPQICSHAKTVCSADHEDCTGIKGACVDFE